jgi:2-polyprenyl-3-methyl-5-hydroxy-6-metoxy-1,4-benzoquinol methylase
VALRWKIAQYVELRWWKNYLKGKEPAQYKAWKIGYWSELMQKINQYLIISPGQLILDAGCGPAGIFIYFNNNYNVTAIDPLLDSYSTNVPNFNKKDYPHTQFINSSIEDYSTASQYDFIFCMNAINHVKNYNQAVAKLAALCKKGGKLIYTIDAHHYRGLKHLFRILPGDVLHPIQKDLTDYIDSLCLNNCVLVHKEMLKRDGLFDHYVLILEKQ